MAFKLPEFLTKTDAKSRLLLLVIAASAVGGIVYLAAHYLSGDQVTARASVAGPGGLQSVPGSKVSEEYYKAIVQNNQQAAKQAQISGTSSVPTMVNLGTSTAFTGGGNCGSQCVDENTDTIADDINSLVRDGKLTQDDANTLADLTKNNVPVAQFAAELDQLVKAGKLSPEDARRLLDAYKKHYRITNNAEGQKTIDGLIKSGQIPLETGAEIIDLQKRNLTPAQYAAELDRLVREGKLKPEVAQQLKALYLQQAMQEGLRNNAAKLKQMVASGEITNDVATQLSALQQRGVGVDEYARALQRLVSEGKLTPATAEKLLEEYKRQRESLGPAATLTALAANNAAVGGGADLVKALYASGKISQETGNQILAWQKQKLSPEEYQKHLQELVAEGKLSQADADALAAAYSGGNVASVSGLLASGKISQETANELAAIEAQHPSVDDYKKQLQAMVAAGKISQADADALLANYTKNTGSVVAGLLSSGKISRDTADQLMALANQHLSPEAYQKQLQALVAAGKLSQADADALMAAYTRGNANSAAGGVEDLLASGKISQETANALLAAQNRNVSPEEYQAQLEQLVREGKLTPEEAQKLLADYTKAKARAAMAQKLKDLQANNASTAEYTNMLKQAVIDGIMTPDEAADLLQQYQLLTSPAVRAGTPVVTNPNIPGAADFAKLQQRMQEQQVPANRSPTSNSQQFTAAQSQAAAEVAQARQQRLQDLMNAMKGQADKLITAWQAPTMALKGSMTDPEPSKGLVEGAKAKAAAEAASAAAANARPLIKAGTIYFAVLDTAVNSDYPDTPVLATIVSGPLKGAKLMGKVTPNQGQNQDRVSLNFTLMDMDSWDKTKSVTAFAIDPDTARTVLASNVDNHYLKRYGAMMATSFLSGYSSAITNAGTSATTLTGMATTHPELNPGNRFAVGLGTIGTNLGNVTQNYTNMPPTITVNAGVGLGILFMGDVSS